MDKNHLAVNTYNKIAPFYTKKYFNDLSDSKYLDIFLDFLPNGAKILDVGSGPGQFSKYIKEKGFDVSGIDYSDKMVAMAKNKVPGVVFQKMDMRKLDFETKTFDGLLSSYSLIHIPSNQIHKTLEGFYRILKPNGYLEVIAQKGKANQIVDQPSRPTEKMFFNFFTMDRLTKFLIKSRFKIVFQEENLTSDINPLRSKILYVIAKKI